MEVRLENLLCLRQRAAREVTIVLVPVAGGQRRGIDRGLQVALVDVCAAGVDRQAEHGEQHEQQQGDQDNGLALLQLSLPGLSCCTQPDKPHKQ